MWRLKEIEFQNLFTFTEKTVIKFEESGSTYIVCGHNYDDMGADSNGAGKSSVFDVINWVLLGNMSRHSDMKKAINRHCSEGWGWGRLTLVNDNKEAVIYRSRGITEAVDNRKKKLKFTIVTGGVSEDCKGRTPTLIQEAIFDYFGLGDKKTAWTDYLSRVCFTTSSTKGFLSSDVKPMDRQRILERYLNLERFDKAHVLAKDEKKEIKVGIDGIEASIEYEEEELADVSGEYKKLISVLISNIIKHKKGIADIVEKLKSGREARRKYQELREASNDTKTQFEILKSKREDLKIRYKYLKENKTKYDELSVKLQKLLKKRKFNVDVLKKLNDQKVIIDGGLESLRKDRSSLSFTVQGLEQKIKVIHAQIRKGIRCPECFASLMIDSEGSVKKLDIKSLEHDRDKYIETLDGVQHDVDGLIAKITKQEKRVSDIEQKIVATRTDEYEIDKVRDDIAILCYTPDQMTKLKVSSDKLQIEHKNKQIELQKFIDKTNAYYDGCVKVGTLGQNEDVLDVNRIELQNQITECERNKVKLEGKLETRKKCEKKIKDLNDSIKKDRANLQLATFWVEKFPEIKSLVLSGFVPLFESKVNEYLRKFEVKEQVEFKLYDEGKSDNIKKGFKIKVFDGKKWEDIEMYSGGEKARVLIACGYALRELSEQVATNSFGFLLVDELLDNIDTTGIDRFFELSKTLEGQKLVITHAKPDEVMSKADGIIVVTKENDVSICEVING